MAPLPVPVDASRSGVLDYDVDTEYPAIAGGVAHDGFAVVVHLKAPALVTAAPLDLVAVLDVSESMANNNKLAHVKSTMAFVIDRLLGPGDRLSVIAISGDDARQALPLTCMTDDGKASAKRAVDTLPGAAAASSSTPASKVSRNEDVPMATASVILVSDGHGSCAALPKFLLRKPVHTFGLGGSDNMDATELHGIAEATGGTFSFVEDHASIQDALAQCVAGLLSVTARYVCLKISSGDCSMAEDDLKITAAKSGRYETTIVPSGEGATVDVGELYADEERRILLFLDVPRLDDLDHSTSGLINVRCTYMDVASTKMMTNDDGCYDIYRDVDEAEPAGGERCVEVERELLRAAAAEDMATARDAAEKGDYAEAARILDARRESVRSSAPGKSGDVVCAAVVAELHELSRRVADEREYKKTGRACILASMSSHSLQRGSSSTWLRVGSGVVGSSSSLFATPVMRKMEKLSETMRKKQQAAPPPLAPPTLPENRSKTGVPLVGSRRHLEARLASAVPRLSMMLGKYRRLLLKR